MHDHINKCISNMNCFWCKGMQVMTSRADSIAVQQSLSLCNTSRSCALQTTDEGMVPLTIQCWPSASGGDSYVNIEYSSTIDFDLQNVAIAIPLPALASSPKVNQV